MQFYCKLHWHCSVTTTIITVYGITITQDNSNKITFASNAGPPLEPVGLSSELSPVAGVLVLSWSPPWTPDGVQLHYTVTVWTNTSTITMFNTSSTTITISRDNITTSDSTSECDQYVWSVTAINPAGTSTPTNITATIPSGLPVPLSSPLWDNFAIVLLQT